MTEHAPCTILQLPATSTQLVPEQGLSLGHIAALLRLEKPDSTSTVHREATSTTAQTRGKRGSQETAKRTLTATAETSDESGHSHG